MKITEKFEINSKGPTRQFSIRHKEVPIRLTNVLDEAIKMLLWYVPNISSEQARVNDLLLNPFYDTYIFTEIMEQMNIRDEDILITEEIKANLVKFFRGEVRVDEQKLIMTLADNDETKTMALLRHVRNAIAHGNFNVIDDLVIGFDVKKIGDKTDYKGIFKIKPSGLLKALRKINEDFTNEKLIATAFRRCSYKVEVYEEKYQRSHRFDLYARKGNKRFAIEVKTFDFREIMSRDFVREMIGKIQGIDSDLRPVLIINSSFLSDENREDLIRENVLILDIKNIKKMQKGRDMLEEIVTRQEENNKNE